jgi:predicted AlkP superfamily phosphohydrolase/phosphomutase
MTPKWFQQPSQRACVVGLDGVPHSMLTRFMADGVMPRLGEIAARGVVAPMTVSLPEISSVSWSTFMTGRNPGEHGIFGFTDLHEGTYKTSFPSFRDVKTETIWDRIGAAKMRSVVINQPATYPARPIHGALVSGFVAIHLDKSVFPAKLLPTVKGMGYEVDLDAGEVRDNPPLLFERLHQLLGLRRRLMDELWTAEKWNLMEVVVTGTDRLHHFMFDAYEDESHEHHDSFLDYYRAVDDFVAYVHDKFEGDNFFVLSDHGFCRTRHEAYVNTVLAQNGYLKFTKEGATDLADISEASTAFALDPARIYIHRRGKYPRGSVGEGDVERIKDELKSLFAGLSYDGEPVVRFVFDGNDVYSGPQSRLGPDLLVVPHNGFDFKGRIGADAIIGARRLQGMHTWDDAFFLTSRADLMDRQDELTLVDVPAKILKSLDVD